MVEKKIFEDNEEGEYTEEEKEEEEEEGEEEEENTRRTRGEGGYSIEPDVVTTKTPRILSREEKVGS